MLVCLLSAKGSPGATTTALCLTAAAGAGGLMVELDPAGGDLACWRATLGEPGLVGLATSLRPAMTGHDLAPLTVEATGGVWAVTAPTTERAMAAVLAQCGDRLGPVLAGVGGEVFVDLGRRLPSSPLPAVAAGADGVLVVVRPTLESIEHARDLLCVGGQLDAVTAPVGVVVVGGTRPYGPHEIASALGRPVAGVLPWEPRSVLALIDQGAGRAWQRSALAAAASDLLARARTATGTVARV